MSKLNEVGVSRLLGEDKKMEKEEPKEDKRVVPVTSSGVCQVLDDRSFVKAEDEKKILRFTMLFNKFNSDFDMKRNRNFNDDVKYAVFFNKDVVAHNKTESVQPKNSVKCATADKDSMDVLPVRSNKVKFCFHKSEPEFGKPHFSEPEMMFSETLTPAISPNLALVKIEESESTKKNFNKKHLKLENKNSLVQLNVHPALRTDLRLHSSLTSLSQTNSLTGVLRSKIPSLTAIEGNEVDEKSQFLKVNQWDHWDDLVLMQHDVDKRINLQISRSSNDNNRRATIKFKKEDCASVSDSKLLYAGTECKKQIKKCDKKSRGDSFKREREAGNRKQVQWKTEVDVIYFSTHLAANGDRTGEVIGRVMEPLREEWEQQRKGFYAKMVPYHMESHLKDRFISLLKI